MPLSSDIAIGFRIATTHPDMIWLVGHAADLMILIVSLAMDGFDDAYLEVV